MGIIIGGNTISNNFNTSGEITNTPEVVTNGLFLWFDAGNNFSYINSPNYYDCGYGPQYYSSDPGCPPCNSQWKDLSGYGNDGLLTNGPTITYDNNGGSLYFDGSNDYVSISTVYLGNGNVAWTANAWIKTTTTANGLGEGPLFCNSSSGPVYSELGINAGKIVYWTYQSSNWSQKLGVGKNVNDNTWHLLTWVNYTNYTMDMYVDGVLDSNVANSTSGNNNPIDMIAGSWNSKFNGYISSVSIYTRSLSSNEVTQNFNNGRQRFGI